MANFEFQDIIQSRADQFLKSRKTPEARLYSQGIINYLIKRREAGVEWVRAKEIHDVFVESGEIPYSTTVFRLLDDLTKYKIIERRKCPKNISGPGKAPVFYRVTLKYPEYLFLNRDELLERLRNCYDENIDYSMQLRDAIDILESCGVGSGIKEKIRDLARKRRDRMEQYIDDDITENETDPCQPS